MKRRLCQLVVAACLALCATGASAQKRSDARPAAARQRLDLNLYRADLRNVLRLLAEAGGVNLVIGDGIDGEVTMKLEQVPWKDALRAVLSSKGLEAELQDGVLRVGLAADFAERREAELSARARCLETAPLRTRIVRLSYADAARMAELVRATLSERGSVSVDARTNSLIIRDVDCRSAQSEGR